MEDRGWRKTDSRSFSPSSILYLLSSLLLLTLAAGCANKPAKLDFTSADGERVFEQKFKQAYITRSNDSDYEIVLISDVHPTSTKPGSVLETSELMPVRQFVDLRVLWQPRTGVRSDYHPAAINAAFDWYLFGDPTASSSDLLHYAGTALVYVYPNGNKATVDIHNAKLKLKERRGTMTDAIGESHVEGRFVARRDTQRLTDLLAQLKSATQTSPEIVAAPGNPSEPPPRTPGGP